MSIASLTEDLDQAIRTHKAASNARVERETELTLAAQASIRSTLDSEGLLPTEKETLDACVMCASAIGSALQGSITDADRLELTLDNYEGWQFNETSTGWTYFDASLSVPAVYTGSTKKTALDAAIKDNLGKEMRSKLGSIGASIGLVDGGLE